jgi:hypothetical protein
MTLNVIHVALFGGIFISCNHTMPHDENDDDKTASGEDLLNMTDLQTGPGSIYIQHYQVC